MYAVDITFKNGSKLEGLIWRWTPKKGVFEALNESNGNIKSYKLQDVKEGKWYSDRVRKYSECSDFIERAVADGWKG